MQFITEMNNLRVFYLCKEFLIYMHLAAPPAPIIKRYSIPEFLLKLKTHPLSCASGYY